MLIPNDPKNAHNAAPTGEVLARRAGAGLAIGTLLLIAAVVTLISQAYAAGLVLLVIGLVLVATGAAGYSRGRAQKP